MASSTPVRVSNTEQRLEMTYEEFRTWSDEGVHAEWVDGEVIIFVPPKLTHQALVDFFVQLLALFAKLFNQGRVVSAPFEMKVTPDANAREPDLIFVAQANLTRLTEDRLAGPADLIIEIISEDSVHRDRVDKFYEYQESGVREYWLIDPREGKQRVDFYYLSDQGQYLPIAPDDEGRYHSYVLAGFWLKADWLWEDPLPNPLALLSQIQPDIKQKIIDLW